MSIIEHYMKSRQLTLQEGGLFEVGRQMVNGQSLLGYVNAPNSMRDMWLLATGHGDAEYLIYNDERWTYAQAAREVAAFASYLSAQGVKPGDRVAIAMRNYPEWMLAHWAINSIGAVVVGMNAWWVADEMAYALGDSNPCVLIADDRRLLTFSQVADDFPNIHVVSVREANSPVTATPGK